MPQISAYLDATERAAIGDYARLFGLDGSAIANLLLARELRVERLLSLNQDAVPKALGGKREKITAHQPDGSVLSSFRAHAVACGLTASAALGLLVRLELAERWLEKAVAKVDSN